MRASSATTTFRRRTSPRARSGSTSSTRPAASRSSTASSASRARAAASTATSRRSRAYSAASGWPSSRPPRACCPDRKPSRAASAAKSFARFGKEIDPMSRIGRKEISVPKGVEVKHDGNVVTVKGPKGTLTTAVVPGIGVSIENNVVQFTRSNDEGRSRAFHGLMRALVANNVRGVTDGFKRELDIIGVGYRAEVKGKEVVFALGYSHPVRFPIPEGIDIAVEPKTNHITITGIDKQKVGQTAAEIRSLREPDPYKGKGIKYSDEQTRRKPGKPPAK